MQFAQNTLAPRIFLSSVAIVLCTFGGAALLYAAADSVNYQVPRDVVPAGGGEESKSTNYILNDTIGEQAVGPLVSANYTIQAGYRQVQSGTTLSLACDTGIDIGSIVSDGQQTGTGSCIVITDYTGGYSLTWSVQSGSGGTSTGYLISELNDTIAPFSPGVVGVPEPWSVAASSSAWGGRLLSASADTDAKWGTDAVSENWLNVSTGSYVVVSRDTATHPAGSVEFFGFRAEIGSSAIQPSGQYQATVTITASAL